MIVKNSNTRWTFDGTPIDLGSLEVMIDLVGPCSHHPQFALAWLREEFKKSVPESDLKEMWYKMVNINNRGARLEDGVFTALGRVSFRYPNGTILGYKNVWSNAVPYQIAGDSEVRFR